ncbi:MAG: hypothetical protein ABW212_00075, partial [Pseudonocardia sediminis]
MSDRRRRPGDRGALFLLLLGVIFLGAGVLLHLYGSDDREVVAQDVGSLPGTTTTVSRPLAEDIPVLSGLDELLVRPGSAPSATGVPGLNGGFDGSGPGGPPGGPALPAPGTRTDSGPGGMAPGGTPPGAVAPAAAAPAAGAATDPAVPGSPVPGGPVPGGPVPGGPIPGSPIPGSPIPGSPAPGSPIPGSDPALALPAPGTDPSARAQAADERSVLADP